MYSGKIAVPPGGGGIGKTNSMTFSKRLMVVKVEI
jgi:hypothetical protein